MVVCRVCGRKLKSKQAIKDGMGCVCKKKLVKTFKDQRFLDEFGV